MTVTNVVVVKDSLIGSGSMLSDPAYQYNYALRRLLERVSWYVEDRDGEARITFAHIRRFPYRKLRAYLEVLRVLPDVQIRWHVIRGVRINQPGQVRLLQMADLTAGCVHSAVRANEFGEFEPTYLMRLVPRIYVRGTARVSSYGMNIIGAKGCMDAFPWWDAFVAACADR